MFIIVSDIVEEFMKSSTVCTWALTSKREKLYHDTEWGIPLHDDAILLEYLVLECMQDGLSWSTILLHREAMRDAFDGLSINVIAQYDTKKSNLYWIILVLFVIQ